MPCWQDPYPKGAIAKPGKISICFPPPISRILNGIIVGRTKGQNGGGMFITGCSLSPLYSIQHYYKMDGSLWHKTIYEHSKNGVPVNQSSVSSFPALPFTIWQELSHSTTGGSFLSVLVGFCSHLSQGCPSKLNLHCWCNPRQTSNDRPSPFWGDALPTTPHGTGLYFA